MAEPIIAADVSASAPSIDPARSSSGDTAATSEAAPVIAVGQADRAAVPAAASWKKPAAIFATFKAGAQKFAQQKAQALKAALSKANPSSALTIALAAALGAGAGSLVTSGIGAVVSRGDAGAEHVLALQESIRSLAVEIRAMNATVATAGKETMAELASISDRVGKGEAAQAALKAEVGKVRSAGAVSDETTGSIASPAPGVARGWVLWRVREGRALIGGNFGTFEVVPGSRVPGLGLVHRIAREDGRWVVATQNGLILSPRG
jgi:hypothetical protein